MPKKATCQITCRFSGRLYVPVNRQFQAVIFYRVDLTAIFSAMRYKTFFRSSFFMNEFSVVRYIKRVAFQMLPLTIGKHINIESPIMLLIMDTALILS
jgi:hypothetical protein